MSGSWTPPYCEYAALSNIAGPAPVERLSAHSHAHCVLCRFLEAEVPFIFFATTTSLIVKAAATRP